MQEKPKRDFFTDKIIEIVDPKNAEDFTMVSALLKCIKSTEYYVGEDKTKKTQPDKI